VQKCLQRAAPKPAPAGSVLAKARSLTNVALLSISSPVIRPCAGSRFLCVLAVLVCRYYFYAQDGPTQALFLVEMLVATESRQATVTLKSDGSPQLVAQFLEVWRMCLAGFYR
jgi:hypothetical protein